MREIGAESSSSPTAKRCRDPEDEVYLDNFHSQKRYLSEIMASSLNGLTVEDSLSENVMVSPARSETMCYLRDEISLQYSPMSEDSDDARCSETPPNTSMVQSDSLPTSPVSPHRHQRSFSSFSSTTPTTSYPLLGCNLASVACSQPRQRGSDSEGRFPSSPSDICHSADLRRAALLRSVQMRSQPLVPPSYDLSFNPGQEEPMQNIEADEQTCSCVKSLVGVCECQNPEQVSNLNLFVEECSPIGMSESGLGREKPCRVLDMNVKEEPGGGGGREVLRENGLGRGGERRSMLSGNTHKACVDSSN
ncbi:hypothetical protein BVC80_9091g72 [Macleaya cordata]|uniref:Uncharacterized protein n=1 Tax=Macleaya cordata TaxID=56857 RepID=A0A200PWL0_MACCD|nr:hypothetical protein BVC80_9091g72 [Macleaya cordata]